VTTLFVIISVLGLLAALGTVLARNLVHAALHLVAFFFVVACQFVLLEAEFLAAVQVLVYIGAVAILMMFGIMLTRRVQGDDTTTVARGVWTVPALIAGLALFLVLVFGINGQVGLKGAAPWKAAESRPPLPKARPRQSLPPRAAAVNDMGRTVGRELVTRFAVPFEVAGLLLTAALVGAVVVAFREGDDAESPRRGRPATWSADGGDGHAAGNGRAEGAEAASAAAG
jgi:NADH-quinone oxidoreductase subunit J